MRIVRSGFVAIRTSTYAGIDERSDKVRVHRPGALARRASRRAGYGGAFRIRDHRDERKRARAFPGAVPSGGDVHLRLGGGGAGRGLGRAHRSHGVHRNSDGGALGGLAARLPRLSALLMVFAIAYSAPATSSANSLSRSAASRSAASRYPGITIAAAHPSHLGRHRAGRERPGVSDRGRSQSRR